MDNIPVILLCLFCHGRTKPKVSREDPIIYTVYMILGPNQKLQPGSGERDLRERERGGGGGGVWV